MFSAKVEGELALYKHQDGLSLQSAFSIKFSASSSKPAWPKSYFMQF
jgi:hypothetical protein